MFYALKIMPVGEFCQIEIIAQLADRKEAELVAQAAKQNDQIMANEYIVSSDPETLMALTIRDLSGGTHPHH
jgi:hypothetical protein